MVDVDVDVEVVNQRKSNLNWTKLVRRLRENSNIHLLDGVRILKILRLNRSEGFSDPQT